MSDCVFCKIARGEIPAQIVYQDGQVTAFKDADPKAPDKTYAKRGAFLDPYGFDPTEFGIPPSIPSLRSRRRRDR